MMPQETHLKAIFESDASYDGIFYTAVTSTGIYCLPSCRAKKPSVKNIMVFSEAEDAERNGFRACKKCVPDIPVRSWGDAIAPFSLRLPPDFDFGACLRFFERSPIECLHHVEEGRLRKLIRVDGHELLLEIAQRREGELGIDILNARPTKALKIVAARYVAEWFDLATDLHPFYAMAARDRLLGGTIERYRGLRLIGILDLFESLTWAITGQQINLQFAYTLKRRFVEAYGTGRMHGDLTYRLYPTAEAIAPLSAEALTELGFTRMKSEFIIGIARLIAGGELSREKLLADGGARERLMAIRGVGEWTASYVLMRTLRDRSALMATDVGLQNAIRTRLGLPEKPDAETIRKLARPWNGWEAYATFYLWMTLLPDDSTKHTTSRR
jgi:DNA-3-methyladenine glycosylase II